MYPYRLVCGALAGAGRRAGCREHLLRARRHAAAGEVRGGLGGFQGIRRDLRADGHLHVSNRRGRQRNQRALGRHEDAVALLSADKGNPVVVCCLASSLGALGNLRVYKGAEHPHAAQMPEALDIAALNRKNARV